MIEAGEVYRIIKRHPVPIYNFLFDWYLEVGDLVLIMEDEKSPHHEFKCWANGEMLYIMGYELWAISELVSQ